MQGMAYFIFLKSFRSLQEFKKNTNIKIPPKCPCTNFQSIGIFKNSIFIPKIIFLQISAQSAQPPTDLFGLSAHAAHPAFLPPSPCRPSTAPSSSHTAAPWMPPPPPHEPWSPQRLPPSSIDCSYPTPSCTPVMDPLRMPFTIAAPLIAATSAPS
jgi:hypothetical protein